MTFYYLPNALSISRIILTVPVIWTLLNHHYFATITLFLIAGITDILDGWIAKRYSLQTRLGSMLDPIADKILLVGSFITLYIINLLPLWLLTLIFLRDLMIVSGTIGSFMGAKNSKDILLTPVKLSKINTALQISLAFFLINSQFFLTDSKLYLSLSSWNNVFFIIVATSTILSGIIYIWVWAKNVISHAK